MNKIDKIIRDFNGSSKTIVAPYSKKLSGGYELNISKFSGLVSVIKRRSSKQIANEWSKKIFGNKFSRNQYTAKVPAVIARHTYVLEKILEKINVNNKKICDLGAGEGQFLEMLKKKNIKCDLFGIEPSKKNCNLLKKKKLKYYLFGRGLNWFDMGDFDDLLDAGNFIRSIEKRHQQIIACPEEIAYKKKWINKKELISLINNLGNNSYKKYLSNLLKN